MRATDFSAQNKMSQQGIEYRVVKLLKEKSLTVFTAESCTGGLICKLLTDVPGASSVVRGGVISYVNEIKMSVLGVKSQTIEKYTEVSESCCAEMAQGAVELSGADIGLSVTGYASDGEGVPQGMAGIVFVGICDKNGTDVTRIKLDGTREEVRQTAAERLLKLLCDRMELG